MTIKKYTWFKPVLLMFITGFLFSCTGGKVQVDLPSTHPAHPRAQEATFSPVANPYIGGLSESTDPSEPHGDQDETPTHQEKMGGHHSHSRNSADDKQPGHMHGEDGHQKPHGGTVQ